MIVGFPGLEFQQSQQKSDRISAVFPWSSRNRGAGSSWPGSDQSGFQRRLSMCGLTTMPISAIPAALLAINSPDRVSPPHCARDRHRKTGNQAVFLVYVCKLLCVHSDEHGSKHVSGIRKVARNKSGVWAKRHSQRSKTKWFLQDESRAEARATKRSCGSQGIGKSPQTHMRPGEKTIRPTRAKRPGFLAVASTVAYSLFFRGIKPPAPIAPLPIAR